MPKKSLIAVLGAVVLMVVASIALVFTVGPMASADSEEIVPVDTTKYLNIDSNGVLGDGSSTWCNAFNAAGRKWIEKKKYRVEIPDTVTSIGRNAFQKCNGLVDIEIPATVTKIGAYAFDGCINLTSIEIPSSVTSIDYDAFAGCNNLISIKIPNSVASLSSRIFKGCSGLTSVDIPSSVTSIGDYVFSDCGNLTSVEIPSGVTNIGEYAFNGCSSLTSIEIPSGITNISNGMFSGCIGLTNLEIPSSATRIGSYAFKDCRGLTEIVIPSDVTSIGDAAFIGCSGLMNIEVPSNVTSIGALVFKDCSNLIEIIVRNLDLMTDQDLQLYADKLHYGANQNKVTFYTMGGTEVSVQMIDFGEIAEEPSAPTKENAIFLGWYLDEAFTKPYTFDTSVKYDIDLYAKWEQLQPETPVEQSTSISVKKQNNSGLIGALFVCSAIMLSAGGAAGYFFIYKRRRK